MTLILFKSFSRSDMKELNAVELDEVSGGVIPIMVYYVGFGLFDAAIIAYDAYQLYQITKR